MTTTSFDKLNQFQKVFHSEEACMAYYEAIRWPDGIRCVYCSHDRCYSLKKPFHYKCANKSCLKKFNLFSDTLFAKSKLSFDTWFLAIYMIVTHRTGWSSKQAERNLDASQGATWFLLHRIRHAMKQEITEKLKGIVEVDECMFGPIVPNMHKWRIPKDVDLRGRSNILKKPIVGMVQRQGELRLFVADDASSATLDRLIEQNIEKGATVYTDEHRGYCNVKKSHRHGKVSHGKKEYVSETNRACHVNTVEKDGSTRSTVVKDISRDSVYLGEGANYSMNFVASISFGNNPDKVALEAKYKEIQKVKQSFVIPSYENLSRYVQLAYGTNSLFANCVWDVTTYGMKRSYTSVTFDVYLKK